MWKLKSLYLAVIILDNLKDVDRETKLLFNKKEKLKNIKNNSFHFIYLKYFFRTQFEELLHPNPLSVSPKGGSKTRTSY